MPLPWMRANSALSLSARSEKGCFTFFRYLPNPPQLLIGSAIKLPLGVVIIDFSGSLLVPQSHTLSLDILRDLNIIPAGQEPSYEVLISVRRLPMQTHFKFRFLVSG